LQQLSGGFERPPTIDAEICGAVMALPQDERRDRAKVNEAVRDCLRIGPMRLAGSGKQASRRSLNGGHYATKFEEITGLTRQ
jgi:hypothetical protein